MNIWLQREEYRRRGWLSFVEGDELREQSLRRAERYSGETVEFTTRIRRIDGAALGRSEESPDRRSFTGKFTRLVASHRHHRTQTVDALRE
jgi:hypothetical protein